MLRDITIGQHFPGNSLVHRFDPRLKLVLTIAYIVLLFAASNPLGLALSILFLAVMYKVAKIPGKMILKSLKPILPIVIFTAVLNLFFVSGEGEPLVHIWFLTIYAEGVRYAVLMAVRVMALIAGTSLLTYTTSPIVLTDAIEQLLKPLGKLHFPVHELAMMMSIALRFIPTLIEETDKIMNAQKARGAQLDTGKMTDRVKALVPVLIPLFISAFRRADELAMAMECRCYHGGEGRTRLKVLKFGALDVKCAVVLTRKAGLYRSGRVHRLLCSDPCLPAGVPEFLREATSPSQSFALLMTAPPKGEPLAEPRTLPYCQGLSLWERWHRRSRRGRAC